MFQVPSMYSNQPAQSEVLARALGQGLQSGIESYYAKKKENEDRGDFEYLMNNLGADSTEEDLGKILGGRRVNPQVLATVLGLQEQIAGAKVKRAQAAKHEAEARAAPIKAQEKGVREARLNKGEETKARRLKKDEAVYLQKRLKDLDISTPDEEKAFIEEAFSDALNRTDDVNKAWVDARKAGKTEYNKAHARDVAKEVTPDTGGIFASSTKSRFQQIKALKKELASIKGDTEARNNLIKNGFTPEEADEILDIKAAPNSKPLNPQVMQDFLNKTGNDPQRAKELARNAGYIVP